MRTTPIRKSGFTLVEIMVVVAIIGLLAAVAIPNFVRARTTAQMNACINNLRQIDGAKQQWALEYKQVNTAVPAVTDLQSYLVRGTVGVLPLCPASGTSSSFALCYNINDIGTAPDCKIAPSGLSAHTLP